MQVDNELELVSDVCGLVLPGYPLQFAWQKVGPAHLTLTLINSPSNNSSNAFPLIAAGNSFVGHHLQNELKINVDLTKIDHFTVFLLPGAETKLPPGKSLALYYSTKAPYNMWTILGAISVEKPSAIFSVPFLQSEIQSFCNNNSSSNNPFVMKLGLSIESTDVIVNLEQNQSIERGREKENLGVRIAEDLYNFFGSFSQTTNQGEQLVIPANALDRWITRFKRKFIS